MGTLELLLWLGKVFHAFHIYERRKRLRLAGEIIGQTPLARREAFSERLHVEERAAIAIGHRWRGETP
jgi:hypothetical protein